MAIKDKLTITVSDVNGTKSYSLHKIIKKIFLWSIPVILIIGTVSFLLISHLSNSVDELSIQSKNLIIENHKYSQKIESKIKSIKELSTQLNDIENIIGISKDKNTTLIQRATLAKLTSAQRTYMLNTIPSQCPLEECKTTSKFGWRNHPVTKEKKYHKGIDLRAKRRTEVFTTADGVVRFVNDKDTGAWGRAVIVAHNFGFETVYAHLRFVNVKIGDVVKKGQLIAKSGNSGRTNGPHLHYEVRYATRVLNPQHYINWDIKNYEQIFSQQRSVKWESLVNLIKNQNQVMVQQ
ncbi:MAG: M23 family metallopeptidase [Campylobacterota bacterium]|nr:M23 family metallopeptidase [Campylobacterota bacterium]